MGTLADATRERAHARRGAAPADGTPGPTRATVSLDPASAYEAVTRQMVVGLQEDLREIKGRLNGLLFLMAGSMLLDLLRR